MAKIEGGVITNAETNCLANYEHLPEEVRDAAMRLRELCFKHFIRRDAVVCNIAINADYYRLRVLEEYKKKVILVMEEVR